MIHPLFPLPLGAVWELALWWCCLERPRTVVPSQSVFHSHAALCLVRKCCWQQLCFLHMDLLKDKEPGQGEGAGGTWHKHAPGTNMHELITPLHMHVHMYLPSLKHTVRTGLFEDPSNFKVQPILSLLQLPERRWVRNQILNSRYSVTSYVTLGKFLCPVFLFT